MENDLMNLICDKCKVEYQIKRKTYLGRIRKGSPNYCRECMKVYQVEATKLAKENMSEERKAEYSRKLSEANKKYWKEMDENLKETRFDQLRKLNDEFQKSMTPEKWQEHTKKIIEGHAKMSEEAKNRMHANQSKSMTEHHAKMSIEEKQLFSQQIKAGMNKMTYDEKENMKRGWSDWWAGLSDEERVEHVSPMLKGLKDSWNTITDEEFNKRIKYLNDGKKKYLDNISKDDYKKLVHKRLTSSIGTNKLHQKFETMFNESHLINEYYYKPEEVLINDDILHSWDYGIYSKDTNELVMVVDLDGKFFHADECDYDGLHSKEEYDEKRSLSINGNIKHFIIQELNFKKCFELMIKELMMNYDDYVEYTFKTLRAMPFPVPRYTDIELIKSYNSLYNMDCNSKYHTTVSLNTRVGDRLITNFHESIYQAHTRGNISPYEAWYDDELLKKVIENRIIYQNYLNPNKILQGFNVSKVATKVSVFSAGRAKMLINKYLLEYNEVFDPFSGFSGRMLGTISLGKKYIGQDISEIHVRESNNMIKFLTQYTNIDSTVTCKDILISSGEYECLFTCPPYSDKEQWLEVPITKRTCDDWIDICLENFKCKKYLFVVDNTTKYKNNIVDEIKNKSHFNGNSEYVILIEK